jgi:hypothetical protein
MQRFGLFVTSAASLRYSVSSRTCIILTPKPTTVLRSRKVRIDRAASNPFTTREVLAETHGTPLRGKRVMCTSVLIGKPGSQKLAQPHQFG